MKSEIPSRSCVDRESCRLAHARRDVHVRHDGQCAPGWRQKLFDFQRDGVVAPANCGGNDHGDEHQQCQSRPTNLRVQTPPEAQQADVEADLHQEFADSQLAFGVLEGETVDHVVIVAQRATNSKKSSEKNVSL